MTLMQRRRALMSAGNYLWMYKASSGELLSAQAYATKTTSQEGGTETLENGVLVLHTYSHSTSTGNSHIRFGLTPNTATSSVLKCYAKFVNAPSFQSANNGTGFRLQLSNGTSGAQAYIGAINSKLALIYYEGSTPKKLKTDFSLSDYHLLELRLTNNVQSLKIDGQTVFSSSTLSNNYCTAHAIFNQAQNSAVNPNGVTTNIQWIGYKGVLTA